MLQLALVPTNFAGPRPHGDDVSVPAGAGKARFVLCDAGHFRWPWKLDHFTISGTDNAPSARSRSRVISHMATVAEKRLSS
jgi:hypothetical protein